MSVVTESKKTYELSDIELFEKGRQLFIEGNYDASIDYFGDAMVAGYDPAIARLSRGVAHFNVAHYDEAIEDFTYALAIKGKGAREFLYRGLAYLAKDDFDHALSDLDSSLSLDPDNGVAHVARAIVHTQRGNEELAGKDFKTAITLSDSSVLGFADTNGILRTRFTRVMALIGGETRPYSVELTTDELESLTRWMEEL